MNVVTHRAFMRKVEVEQFFRSHTRGRWNDFAHMASVATVNAYYHQGRDSPIFKNDS
jgi:hypothetical protein